MKLIAGVTVLQCIEMTGGDGESLKRKGVYSMHWMMWVFWGSLAAIFIISYVVDVLTKRKYSMNKKDNTLNQNMAEAEARRDAGRSNHESGMF